MDSRPGLYDSVLVLDYKSLYPSIIRTFLIDPVGLVEGMAQPDPEHSTEGFLDAWFSREKHCLPEIVTNIRFRLTSCTGANNPNVREKSRFRMR